MTDPVHAALWLTVAAVTVLVLCLGGTLIAAGMWSWPEARRTQPARGMARVIAAPAGADASDRHAPPDRDRRGTAHSQVVDPAVRSPVDVGLRSREVSGRVTPLL